MDIFFSCSVILFSYGNYISLWGYWFYCFFEKKATALLLPFFSWSLISTMLFELVSSFIHLESSLQSSEVNPFINIALGYCDFNSPLWFLPCFFITEIILWIVQKIQARIGNKFLIYCVIGSFALCLMWPYMNETEIFWNAHTAVILLPFAVLGRISSIWLNDCNVSIKTTGVATFLLGTGGWLEYIWTLKLDIWDVAMEIVWFFTWQLYVQFMEFVF